MSTAQVRELALGLPCQDRASLARELIESLETDDPPADVEAAWIDEIESRADALDRGEANADDWKTSLDRVRQQLREGARRVNLSVHEAAEKELLEGAKWYEEREPGLGDQFVDEYEAVILRVLAAPRLFPKIETARTRRDIHRCFLRRFPYYVAYELSAEQVRVLAVAHAKRKPNYWMRRH